MKYFVALILLLAGVCTAKYTGPTNQAGLDLIKRFEGFEKNFYNDAVGIKTIGYGHACHSWDCTVPLNKKYSVPLTQATGEALLKDDLAAVYEPCVRNAVTYSNLNANQYAALVSFVFNLGCGNFKLSTLLKKLNAGDVAGAAAEFPKWNKAGGKVLAGLTTRRLAEQTLFNGGTPSPSSGSGSATTCSGVTTDGIRVRSSPNTSASIVTTLNTGTSVTITGRESGTNVNGNSFWFKLSNGYVSAYYVNLSGTNGASWCSKN